MITTHHIVHASSNLALHKSISELCNIVSGLCSGLKDFPNNQLWDLSKDISKDIIGGTPLTHLPS